MHGSFRLSRLCEQKKIKYGNENESMILTENALGKIIHNVLSYDFDSNGGLHFRRFSKSQLRFYAAESENFLIRAASSASVMFDFITDSDYISLKSDLYPGSSQDWAGFDLYVDGIFYEQRRFSHPGVIETGFDLPRGEHRITLHFPWTAETVVHEVRLTDGAGIKAVRKKANVIAFGDSITHGSISQFTSLTYVNQLSKDLELEIVNQGIGGYYFNEASIDETIAPYNPDLLMIAYGTNDYARYASAEAFGFNASEYVKKITGLFPDTKILAILPLYRNDLKHRSREKQRDYTLDDARKILLSLYGKYKNIEVQKETAIPRIPEAYAGDYLHPNELGFTILSKDLEKRVKALLNL